MATKNSNKLTRTDHELSFENPINEINLSSKVVGDNNAKPFLKRYLIVCEGETEAAYFEGLAATFNLHQSVDFTILPEKKSKPNKNQIESSDEQNSKGYDGSIAGLKNLIDKKIQVEEQSYDRIWMVFDNDENSAYQIDSKSISKIRKLNILSNEQLSVLEEKVEIQARQSEIYEGKHRRTRYFLKKDDYSTFLTSKLQVSEQDAEKIIKQTTLRTSVSNFFNTQSPKNKESVAYSCISFEYWILLHFEKSNYPFYNSREIIKYFDDKGYFSNLDNGYQKGWMLFTEKDSLKEFYGKVVDAIVNNETITTPKVKNNHIYEINPYSNVFELASEILNN